MEPRFVHSVAEQVSPGIEEEDNEEIVMRAQAAIQATEQEEQQ